MSLPLWLLLLLALVSPAPVEPWWKGRGHSSRGNRRRQDHGARQQKTGSMQHAAPTLKWHDGVRAQKDVFFGNIAGNEYQSYVGPLLQVLAVDIKSGLMPQLSLGYQCGLLFHYDNPPVQWPPPKEIPKDRRDEYLLGGRVHVKEFYLAHDSDPTKPKDGSSWSPEDLLGRQEHARETCKEGRPSPGPSSMYGVETDVMLCEAVTAYPVDGLSGGVVGTQVPWVEGFLLAMGVRHVTTVEFQKIETNHPKLSSITPFELAAEVQETPEKWYGKFDFVFSYSSIEHTGLGRYGDPLSPYGDLEEMARLSCMLKPGGLLYLGVPVGMDAIEFNAHRIYGPLRTPLLLGNFELLDTFGEFTWTAKGVQHQPIFVLRNTVNVNATGGAKP